MFNRIDLPVSPSHPVALLCALPWLLLTGLAMLLAGQQGSTLLAAAGATLSGAVFQYRRTGLVSGPEAITGLRVEGQRLYARFGSGRELPVVPAGESRIGARFAILKLRRSGSIYKATPVVLVALTPRLCNTSPDAFRQLRVWLRLAPAPVSDKPGKQQPFNVQENH